eukprot:TRINITY_DN813_c1_g2_i1.p1 TRINITY_DN813_c1_g2~~TRINITY_DN813_c1_g2_i1.p1  ORF type:complete len:459 (+),score=67.05 TRINITY_DN813_c1_g2_i1:512-1888(+)
MRLASAGRSQRRAMFKLPDNVRALLTAHAEVSLRKWVFCLDRVDRIEALRPFEQLAELLYVQQNDEDKDKDKDTDNYNVTIDEEPLTDPPIEYSGQQLRVDSSSQSSQSSQRRAGTPLIVDAQSGRVSTACGVPRPRTTPSRQAATVDNDLYKKRMFLTTHMEEIGGMDAPLASNNDYPKYPLKYLLQNYCKCLIKPLYSEEASEFILSLDLEESHFYFDAIKHLFQLASNTAYATDLGVTIPSRSYLQASEFGHKTIDKRLEDLAIPSKGSDSQVVLPPLQTTSQFGYPRISTADSKIFMTNFNESLANQRSKREELWHGSNPLQDCRVAVGPFTTTMKDSQHHSLTLLRQHASQLERTGLSPSAAQALQRAVRTDTVTSCPVPSGLTERELRAIQQKRREAQHYSAPRQPASPASPSTPSTPSAPGRPWGEQDDALWRAITPQSPQSSQNSGRRGW